MNSSVVNLAMQLIKIPSISPLDLGCQKIIYKRLKKIGFKIDFFNINKTKNIFAYRGSKGKHLNFLGHTDVVPGGDERKWKYGAFNPFLFKNKILFGRGSADMKGAIASMIIAAENFIMKNNNYKGKLSFLFTSDEESNGIDGMIKVIDLLKKKKEYIDYCIVGEPSSEKKIGDVIKIGRRGSITFNIKIKGISGHVAYPKYLKNPIHIIIPLLNKLINYKWDNGNKYFIPTSLQITNIFSNSVSSNVSPDELIFQFNIRFSNIITPKKIVSLVKKIFNNNLFCCEIYWKVFAFPFLNKKFELINIVSNTIKKFNGLNTKLSTSGGTSDGRFLNLLTDQIVELGLINKTIHKYNECVKVSDLELLSLLYEDIMNKLLV